MTVFFGMMKRSGSSSTSVIMCCSSIWYTFAPAKFVWISSSRPVLAMSRNFSLPSSFTAPTAVTLLPLAAVRARDKAVMKAHRLAMQEGVVFKEEFRLKSITPASLIGEEKDGREVELPCDTVALSLGVRPRKDVLEALEGVCDEMYVVGDCALRQGNITTAVRDGFYAAMNV